jgi:hypothetical protein
LKEQDWEQCEHLDAKPELETERLEVEFDRQCMFDSGKSSRADGNGSRQNQS